jgi:hypothetical protein
MSSMSGCANYTKLCTGGASQPSECLSYLSTKLPTVSSIQASVTSFCSPSKAAACPSSCTSSTSMAGMPGMRSLPARRAGTCPTYTLDVLSALCRQSPTNTNCAGWSAWCAASVPASTLAAYCTPTSTSGAAPGPMAGAPSAATIATVLAGLLLSCTGGARIAA